MFDNKRVTFNKAKTNKHLHMNKLSTLHVKSPNNAYLEPELIQKLKYIVLQVNVVSA